MLFPSRYDHEPDRESPGRTDENAYDSNEPILRLGDEDPKADYHE
jgi:hypothetical protein